jgi:hypothetical protein
MVRIIICTAGSQPSSSCWTTTVLPQAIGSPSDSTPEKLYLVMVQPYNNVSRLTVVWVANREAPAVSFLCSCSYSDQKF